MVKVVSTKGEEKKEIGLPEIFEKPYRPDLAKKAVLAHQSKRRQNHGADKRTGLKSSAHYEGSRHVAPNSQQMNREMSRMSREHGDTGRRFRALKAPHAVGGRKAHPPKSDKKHKKSINKKERRKAIRCAIAATANPEAVEERNHKFGGNLPIVVEDELQKVNKTRRLEEFLREVGLEEDIERVKSRKVRAGKGKMRGRKYRGKKSVLLVIDEDEGIGEAGSNLPGVDVAKVGNLNVELLSPGAHGARLTIYTESALEKIQERWGK